TATNAEPENGLESNPSNERSHWSHFYAPANLTAANENGPIRLNWTSAYGAGGGITYKIYRGSSLIKEGVETNTYLDDTTFNGVNYCYQVVAVDNYDNLESDTSNQDCAPSEYPYTPQPTGLSAACVNRGINLTWDQLNSFPTVSYTYNVHRSLEPWVLIGHTAELVAENLVFSQYRDEDGKDSTTYYYRVSAVNVETELEGDPSDTVSATSLFSPPTGLTATNDNGVIDLAWTATGGFGDITYNIYHDTDPSVTTASDRVATGISVTHWTDINTDSGTTYWYIVTGVDAFDNLETDASDSASTTSIYPSDARPQKLRAECVNRAIGLTWEPHSTFTGGAVLYTIHRGTSSPLTTVVATNVSDTTWTDTNVDNQITYYYHITADTGPGNPSNEAYATSSFSAPTNLVATNNNGLSINLSWNHTSGFGSITYNIYRDLQSTISTSSPMIATGLAADTYSDTDLVFGTQYYYLVTGVDSRDNVESLSSLPAHATATHIQPSIASISMTGIALEADSAIITYTVTNGPARQVEITIIDQQTGQEVATIIQTENQDGVCTASWDGIWTSEQGTIKHNGRYSAKAQAMDVDNSLSDWTATTSDAWVDVVHIQQPVTIEYTTEGENPPVLGPNYHITYQLTKGAYVVHKIYTDTGALVRTISSDVPRMGEGFERDITVTDYWDLRATNGSFVPNGIYHWQITAYYQGDTSTVTFDLPVQPLRLTDLTTVGIAQSEDKAQINYTLTTDATVTIKIYAPGTTFTGGLDDNGNPIPEDASALVKTLTFSRGKGSHTESWDGTNDTGQVVANDIYMMSIIALDSHRNRAVDYNGSECPFYGTIPVYRGVTPPTLSWTGETGYASDGVNPDKDKAGDTFTYRISYAHQDNTPLLAPPTLHIFKGGTEIDTELMTGVDPYDQTYSDSKLYTVDVSLTDTGADYSYYFEARDINGIPATGIPTRSIVGYMKNGPIVDNTPLVTINQIDRGGFPEIDCYVTVTDQAGDHLGGLISGDFTVTEGGGGFDGTPNTVGSPTAALSTALVMDYSGSMLDPDVVNAEAAANIFVNNMADTDRAAVVKFDETVSLIRGFTSNKGLLRNAISTPYSRGAT
ncbi:VWA domain-containing protein, partial [bacterium]|nr:VWA domain-containing protein [bacterium]